MEGDYSNRVNIQHRYALLSKTDGYQGPGLARVAKERGLPHKSDCSDYSIYTQNTLPDEAIVYAVRDVILPDMIRHMFAPSAGYTTVVRSGMMDYKLTPNQAYWHNTNDKDVTWCVSPQTMTYR
jgi:hypothetical protein